MSEYDVLQELQNEFYERLKAKTSWGRNEIALLYLESINAVLSRRLLKADNDTLES